MKKTNINNTLLSALSAIQCLIVSSLLIYLPINACPEGLSSGLVGLVSALIICVVFRKLLTRKVSNVANSSKTQVHLGLLFAPIFVIGAYFAFVQQLGSVLDCNTSFLQWSAVTLMCLAITSGWLLTARPMPSLYPN